MVHAYMHHQRYGLQKLHPKRKYVVDILGSLRSDFFVLCGPLWVLMQSIIRENQPSEDSCQKLPSLKLT